MRTRPLFYSSFFTPIEIGIYCLAVSVDLRMHNVQGNRRCAALSRSARLTAVLGLFVSFATANLAEFE